MHALEKAALDDPFLADALEGYAVRDVNSSTDIAELKNRLTNRIEKEATIVPIATYKKIAFSWWKIAAMIVVIAGAGLIVYQIGFNSKKNDIAQADVKEKDNNTVANDSSKESSPAFLSADSVSGLAATNQLKDTVGFDLIKPGSSAVILNKKTTATKTDDLGSEEKETAKTETAAPTNAPAVRNDELVLNDDNYKRSNARKEGYAIKNQNTPKDSITVIAQQKAANVTPGLVKDNVAKAQQNRLFNQANVFRGRVTDAQINALPFSRGYF